MNNLRIKKYISAVIKVGVAFAFLYYLIGPNLTAKWGMIDDHAIIGILGADLRLTLQELPSLLYRNVIGTYGVMIRQVPVYLALRLFEAYLWGNNPFLWYFARFIAVVFSFLVFWNILEKHTGVFLGFLFLAYTLTGVYWSGILTRLGTHEIYVIPALAVYALGVHSVLYGQNSKQTWGWFLIFAGTLLCAGTKENMVILAVPNTIVFMVSFLRREINPMRTLFFALSIISAFTIVLGIILMLSKTGHDVYNKSVNSGYRIRLLVGGFAVGFSILKYHLAAAVAVFAMHLYAVKIRGYGKIRDLGYGALYIGTVLLFTGFAAVQFAFYNGSWPTGMRYDFPGMLIIPSGILVLYLYVRKLTSLNSRLVHMHTLNGVVFFCLLLLLSRKAGYLPLRQAASANARETIMYSRKIDTYVTLAKQNPSMPVIIESYTALNYEPIASINCYLNNYGVKNNRFLSIHKYSYVKDPELEKMLSEELYRIAEKGGEAPYWNFKPISLLKNRKNCLSIDLSGSRSGTCKFRETL